MIVTVGLKALATVPTLAVAALAVVVTVADVDDATTETLAVAFEGAVVTAPDEAEMLALA